MSQEKLESPQSKFRSLSGLDDLSQALLPKMILPNQWEDNVSNDDYHARKDSVSSTPVKDLLESELEFAWNFWYAPSKSQTPSMRFGTLVHTCLLEPILFNNSYAVLPEFEGGHATKKYKEARDEFLKEHKGITFITQDEMDKLLWIRDNAHKNPDASALLSEGINERAGFYTDPETGIRCRIKPDILMGSFLADLKTCINPHADEFSRAVWNFRYDLSMAMYAEGIKYITGQAPSDCFWIAIGTSEPHSVAVYRASENAMAVGKSDYRWALNRLKKAIDTKLFHGIQRDEVIDLDLPPWAYARIG